MSNPRAFPYDPRTRVADDREDVLTQRAGALLFQHARRGVRGYQMDFTDFGNILNAINDSSYYGTNSHEKAVVWNSVVVKLYQSRSIRVTTTGLNPDAIDRWGTGVPWGHIVVAFVDGRHGSVGGPDSYTDSTLEQAWNEIVAYETVGVGGVRLAFNRGDAVASYYTVQTMFAFREGGFAAFARKWNELFLQRSR